VPITDVTSAEVQVDISRNHQNLSQKGFDGFSACAIALSDIRLNQALS
jgi:hypothetical protein